MPDRDLRTRLSRLSHLIASLALLAASGAPVVDAQMRGSTLDAEAMKQKLVAIVAHGESRAKQARRTTLSENEVNAYLTFEMRSDLPPGIVDPTLAALGAGRVSGRAVVDLDAVRKASGNSGLLDIRSYLAGRVPVTATGLIRTREGVGWFEFETATVGGVPVPKWLLQEIVAHYSKSPDNPAGVSLDDRFELPASIREIQVQRGHAIIVQ